MSMKKGQNAGAANVRYVHGMAGTKIYDIWSAMKRRCLNPKSKDFPSYGERGITVCDRWMQFKNFFADMGERPTGKMLERKNNDGPYSKDNCKWASAIEQRHNQRPHKKHKERGPMPVSCLCGSCSTCYGRQWARNKAAKLRQEAA